MKLLTSHMAWKDWIRSIGHTVEDDQGRIEMPKSYPCYAYAVVDSFKDCTQAPEYLYRRDIEGMAIELVASEMSQ